MAAKTSQPTASLPTGTATRPPVPPNAEETVETGESADQDNVDGDALSPEMEAMLYAAMVEVGAFDEHGNVRPREEVAADLKRGKPEDDMSSNGRA